MASDITYLSSLTILKPQNSFFSIFLRTNGETIRRSMLFEPGKEQSIAIGLTPVTIVTHIEQYVKMLFKKYVEYGKDSGYQDWWQKQNHHLGRRTPHMAIGY